MAAPVSTLKLFGTAGVSGIGAGILSASLSLKMRPAALSLELSIGGKMELLEREIWNGVRVNQQFTSLPVLEVKAPIAPNGSKWEVRRISKREPE